MNRTVAVTGGSGKLGRAVVAALIEFDRVPSPDHDADIHRADIAAHGKLTVPVLASGGGAQTLAANYAPMCEEIAIDVTGHLVPDAGHWVAEENPGYFCRMFIDFDTSARARESQA
jgi:nucleoside-diphosphate-sugar epimerase